MQVEQDGEQLGAGDAVDHRVVDLGDQGGLAAFQALDIVDAPQRHAAVEAGADDIADEVAELLHGAGPGQAAVAHMVLEVELRVLDPVRLVEVERGFEQAAPEHRQQVQARGDQLLDGLEAEAGRGGRGVEDGQAAHVHGHGIGLQIQEDRVEAAELFHRAELSTAQ